MPFNRSLTPIVTVEPRRFFAELICCGLSYNSAVNMSFVAGSDGDNIALVDKSSRKIYTCNQNGDAATSQPLLRTQVELPDLLSMFFHWIYCYIGIG